jgi:hypothetical protein
MCPLVNIAGDRFLIDRPNLLAFRLEPGCRQSSLEFLSKLVELVRTRADQHTSRGENAIELVGRQRRRLGYDKQIHYVVCVWQKRAITFQALHGYRIAQANLSNVGTRRCDSIFICLDCLNKVAIVGTQRDEAFRIGAADADDKPASHARGV